MHKCNYQEVPWGLFAPVPVGNKLYTFELYLFTNYGLHAATLKMSRPLSSPCFARPHQGYEQHSIARDNRSDCLFLISMNVALLSLIYRSQVAVTFLVNRSSRSLASNTVYTAECMHMNVLRKTFRNDARSFSHAYD
jgi:hypothetical protein